MEKRFLLVENSATLRKMWGLRLRKTGAQTLEAADAEQALSLLETEAVDLILTSLVLPGLDGRELCRKLRLGKKHQKTPIILIHSDNSPTEAEKSYEAGATAVLDQPQSDQAITALVEEVLAQADVKKDAMVMVVDDSSTILRLVEAGLSKAGFAVVTAINGEEALKKLQRHKPDLIISDLDMPVMNGMEFCHELSKDAKLAQIPFMIMSANSEKSVMRKMISQGASAYMVKPFHMEQFVITVEKLMSEQFRLLDADRKRLEADRESMLSTITALINALEARDEYTNGHSRRVSEYAIAIGRTLNLSPEQMSVLEIGSRLHDVGKIGVPDGLLLKPGKLTPEETNLFNHHPTIGAGILNPIKSLAEMIPLVELHHERMDGHGYPRGLKGSQIPLLARITAVADCYDALTSDRPYRKGFPQEKALTMIAEVKGTQLCPESVEAFFHWASTTGTPGTP